MAELGPEVPWLLYISIGSWPACVLLIFQQRNLGRVRGTRLGASDDSTRRYLTRAHAATPGRQTERQGRIANGSAKYHNGVNDGIDDAGGGGKVCVWRRLECGWMRVREISQQRRGRRGDGGGRKEKSTTACTCSANGTLTRGQLSRLLFFASCKTYDKNRNRKETLAAVPVHRDRRLGRRNKALPRKYDPALLVHFGGSVSRPTDTWRMREHVLGPRSGSNIMQGQVCD